MALHELVATAREKLDRTTWDYVIGGSESETTIRRNRAAIDSLGWVPRVLNDVSDVDPGTRFLDASLAMPVLLAPIGSLQAIEPGGGASASQAAADSKVMSIASSVCEPSLEDIATSSDAPKIYQLYVRGDDAWVADMVARVIAAGYKGFCLTVDTAVVSRRERDIAKRVVPTSQQSSEGINFQASLNWSTVEMIKSKFDIPLILKGIAHPEDVRRALDSGVDVIYLSNHGGRQLDGSTAPFDQLGPIVDAVGDQIEVIVDGGVRRGTHVLKALAMGATACMIGRGYLYAVAAGGYAGVDRALTRLREEIERDMILMGCSSLAELDRSKLHRE